MNYNLNKLETSFLELLNMFEIVKPSIKRKKSTIILVETYKEKKKPKTGLKMAN